MDVIRVSYSSLNTFSSCARKFEFSKLYPRVDSSGPEWYAADVGKALHAGYQDFLIRKDVDKAVWEFMKVFPYESEFQQTNNYRGFEAALSTLESMMEQVQMNEYELAQIMRPPTREELAANPEAKSVAVPAIEVPFEINFNGVEVRPCKRYPNGARFVFTGFIDAIMRHVMTGLYRTCDIKTTRMQLNDATAKFMFDSQQVPYGIVVDHVAQGSVEAFEVLYFDSYIDLLEPSVKLYPFMKRQSDVQEWCMNKLIQFEQLARFIESDYFPRNDSGCLFYNKPCYYLEACQSRDHDTLMQWFLMGQEAAVKEETIPWIVADINVGG